MQPPQASSILTKFRYVKHTPPSYAISNPIIFTPMGSSLAKLFSQPLEGFCGHLAEMSAVLSQNQIEFDNYGHGKSSSKAKRKSKENKGKNKYKDKEHKDKASGWVAYSQED